MSTPIAEQLITRAKLSASHRIRRAYGGRLAGTYAHARGATAQRVVLDKGPDIQAAIDSLCALYDIVRYFVGIRVRWDDYRLGQIVALTYPRYGFAAGKHAIIVGRQRDLVTRTILLTLWC